MCKWVRLLDGLGYAVLENMLLHFLNGIFFLNGTCCYTYSFTIVFKIYEPNYPYLLPLFFSPTHLHPLLSVLFIPKSIEITQAVPSIFHKAVQAVIGSRLGGSGRRCRNPNVMKNALDWQLALRRRFRLAHFFASVMCCELIN